MKTIILHIISILMISYGLTFILIYLNLFSFGYTLLEYLEFIFTNLYCLPFFIGIILLIILIFKKDK